MESTLQFTFLRDATHNEHIHFLVYDLDGVDKDRIISETWKDGPRASLNTVEVVVSTPPYLLPAGKTIQYYKQAIQLDYGTGFIQVTSTGGTVIFTLTNTSGIRYGFKDFFVDPASGLVTDVVINNAEPNPLAIVSEEIVAGSGNCNYVNAFVETTEIVYKIDVNGVIYDNATNPFTYSLLRGITNTIIYKDNDGNEVASGLNPYYIGILAVENVEIEVVTDISGATVTTTVTNAAGLILEYSLNGTDWQFSNIFSGMISGDYTMYIRDNHNCEIQKTFQVTAEGTREPFFFISKANALNFVIQEDTSSCDIPKNDENTFAYQNIAQISSCTETLIQTCDKTTTQFKSNYNGDIVAGLRKLNGGETILDVEKKSANLNRFESMDCFIYEYGEGKAGIYFTAGDTYDENGIKNGTYALNGNLPDFAILGNVIKLDGIGAFTITSILFDDRSSVRKKVIVVDLNYIGQTTEAIISSYFDLLPFEIYQFDIDWSLHTPGIYDVIVYNKDSENGEKTAISENIILADDHPNTLRIDYYNDNNRDIFYMYGIEHRIRVPFLSIQAVPQGDEEINLTDNGGYVVDSEIYEADQITFQAMVKSMMRKVSIALGCKFVFVNGVGYVGDGSVEFEPLGQTNLYDVSKKMVKNDVSYNTRNTGNTGVPGDYIFFNIPALIGYGAGLIKR